MSTIDPIVPGLPGTDGSTNIDIIGVPPAGAEEGQPTFTPSPDQDPLLMIRWSDDGGKTWTNERQRSMGKLGAYTWEVNVNRCGTGKERVFELSMTAKTFLALTGIGVEVEILNR